MFNCSLTHNFYQISWAVDFSDDAFPCVIWKSIAKFLFFNSPEVAFLLFCCVTLCTRTITFVFFSCTLLELNNPPAHKMLYVYVQCMCYFFKPIEHVSAQLGLHASNTNTKREVWFIFSLSTNVTSTYSQHSLLLFFFFIWTHFSALRCKCCTSTPKISITGNSIILRCLHTRSTSVL